MAATLSRTLRNEKRNVCNDFENSTACPGDAMKLEWDNNWNIGEERIDADHRALYVSMIEIHKIIENSAERHDVASALQKLRNSAKEHFAYEEGLMRRHSYPSLNKHKIQHSMLINMLSLVIDNIELTNEEIVLGVIEFFGGWLVEDIENNDAALGIYLNKLDCG